MGLQRWDDYQRGVAPRWVVWAVAALWLGLAGGCQSAPAGDSGASCGDGSCQGAEASYCPQDCLSPCPGSCAAAVCTADGAIQACVAAASGCKALAPPVPCPNGQPCKDGSCGAGASIANCGDGKCSPGESPGECPLDCSSDCQPACNGSKCDDGCGGACEGSGCDDGKACTSASVCQGGACTAGPGLACDDGNACTSDVCDDSGECAHYPSGANVSIACSDGDPCTTGDTCSGSKCAGLTPASCDDGDPCTVDTCAKGKGCSYAPAADGAACGAGGVCMAGGCCSCGAGQYCNPSGICVSANSCQGKCGQFDKAATCQCDSECSGYGDCCADYAAVCTSCTPKAASACCDSGKALCSFDSCGKPEQANKLACPFGCATGAGTATDACKADPCGGVPSSGQCLSAKLASFCVNTTGEGATPSLELTPCEAWEVCDDSGGFAWCAPAGAACSPGQQECAPGKADTLRSCNSDGTWQEYPCAGCAPTYLQGMVACPGDLVLTPQTFTVSFDAVSPKAGYTGYDKAKPLAWKPIYALMVLARYPEGPGQPTVLDAAVVDDGGQVTLDFPLAPKANDYVLLGSVGYDPQSGSVNFAVLEPTAPAGMVAVSSDNPLSGAPYWWAKAAAAVASSGSWHIQLAEKSWILQAFDAVRYDWYNAHNLMWGKPGKQLAVWIKQGVDFSCGACFAAMPTASGVLFGKVAATQMWVSSSNETYLSRAVMHHEVGHWTMESFGKSPSEGGSHFLNSKVPPGMAWSEGWATFYSSMARGSPVYYDQQGNGMFWLDLSKASYANGSPLLPFSASGGLVQFADENRVAAALWNAAIQAKEPFKEAGNQAFWDALASPQMNAPPYTRPYNRHVWSSATPDAASEYKVTYTNLVQTQSPAPTLPAFLDALLCAAPELTSAVAKSIGSLPFPVASPICQP